MYTRISFIVGNGSQRPKALGALSGVGGSQWGMCPGGWKKAYEGMIRSIATWGAELGWRGQKNWEKDFSRLQYQALRKAAGAVQGTSAERVNQMAGVEDVPAHLDNNQVRFVARQVEDPSKLGDMLPVGFGEDVDDELAEGEGRRWNDHGAQWVAKEGKKDGFVSTLTRMVSILPEGKPLFGGPCRKVEVEEVDVRPVDDPKDPEAWEKEIMKEGAEGAYVFSDGSLLESGNVGGVPSWSGWIAWSRKSKSRLGMSQRFGMGKSQACPEVLPK